MHTVAPEQNVLDFNTCNVVLASFQWCLSPVGTPNLQCLSLRQLYYLEPIQYKNFLAVPQLRALDLFEMARSEEPTGFELGIVLAALQNLKVR